jgi:hypothetical protein
VPQGEVHVHAVPREQGQRGGQGRQGGHAGGARHAAAPLSGAACGRARARWGRSRMVLTSVCRQVSNDQRTPLWFRPPPNTHKLAHSWCTLRSSTMPRAATTPTTCR